MSSSSNPRRTPMTARDSNTNGLSLKTTTLHKGATFHAPSSPSGISSLRRSQTTLDDVVDAYCRRAQSTLSTIDQTLNGLTSETSESSSLRDNSSPIPRGILNVSLDDLMAKSSVKTEEGRRVLRPRTNKQPSDSGIGSSIVTTPPQKRAVAAPKKGGLQSAGSTITRSAAATTSEKQAGLSQKGYSRISEHVLRPLLSKASLKDFRPIIQDVPRKIHKKEIVCLRDLEKSLLFRAPVSQLLTNDGPWGVTYRRIKDKARTAGLYLEFCLTSLALIHTTVDQLSERDQTRTADRPYTNGYFVDLCDQVRHYASLLSSKDKTPSTGSSQFSMYVNPSLLTLNPQHTYQPYSSSDEIKMHGGIAINGREAELIRITKDGKAFSLRDGREIEDYTHERKEGVPQFKRSMSQTLEDEEEIRRSMARRKKNPTPEELAPKVCKHAGCGKQFARPCDLTKHEKTHSRPWKCPEPTCKYHDQGWPTEKEMDRHYNDKHSSNPHFFTCQFTPCPYKSKRESNCKQHMEKAHGWKYDRTKNNGKKDSIGKSSTANPTPIIPSLPTPTSEQAFGASPQNFATLMGTTIGQADPILIPSYPTHNDFVSQWGERPADLSLDMDLDLSPVADNGTPSTDLSSESLFNFQPDVNIGDDIYSANMQLPPTPSHDLFLKGFPDNAMFQTGPIQMNMQQQPNQPTSLGHSQAHISPIGQGNTMLFTPSSMKDVNHDFMDEGFGDCSGEDFTLFPQTKNSSHFDMMSSNNLFPEMPSDTAGFTQTASQEFTLDSLATANLHALGQMDPSSMDWNMDYAGFSAH
ncbi:uncharacterized protein MKZ38_008408 [Zalerion maritima]|uniref:C2H2-type domain-containing protein n=1 Tax=Zalerion maritima TaxID=339359 RepID=A0AAD5RGP4_9PEZI|nr:uncharacterized protein MKZ38_008408 [Zalerion maritima]